MPNSRERFLNAIHQKKMDRPPLWLMRQAGRYLPEYRALKSQHDFITMVKTPELATEVTLQPLSRFKLDAAIIFSDILVIPEALGQNYSFREEGGIAMDFAIDSMTKIDQLSSTAIPEKLSYVYDALKMTRDHLGNETALIGFSGSPWTLACYMTQGGSAKDFDKIKLLKNEAPEAFTLLMEKLTLSITEYLNLQIDAGVDSIQIFDSWASICAPEEYESASLKWIKAIIQGLKKPVPVILYAKGMNHCLPMQLSTGAKVLSVDWTIDIDKAGALTKNQCALQGNLDPLILTTDPKKVIIEVQSILEKSKSLDGYIFNLGHGMVPQAKIECVEALVETVTSYNYG